MCVCVCVCVCMCVCVCVYVCMTDINLVNRKVCGDGEKDADKKFLIMPKTYLKKSSVERDFSCKITKSKCSNTKCSKIQVIVKPVTNEYPLSWCCCIWIIFKPYFVAQS